MERIIWVCFAKLLFLFLPFLVFSDTDPPKPEVYTEKIRTGGGLFGYNTVTETRIEEFENGNLVRVFRKLTCSGPGWSRCNFVYNAGCSFDLIPFTNDYYNNQHEGIESLAEQGQLEGTSENLQLSPDCNGGAQYYKITKIWDFSDLFNGKSTVIVEPIPFTIP
jgi:hypothetical protein